MEIELENYTTYLPQIDNILPSDLLGLVLESPSYPSQHPLVQLPNEPFHESSVTSRLIKLKS